MRQAIYKIPVFVVVLAMVLPSVGPILDHHYAERLPEHLHVGMDGYTHHTHAYEKVTHTHYHDDGAGKSDYAVAFYNFDSGLSVAPIVFIGDTGMDSFRQYEPTSVFILPSLVNSLAKNNYSSPPERPPKHIA